jgi:hypothetical protein
MNYRSTATVLLCICWGAAAQSNEWPAFFSVPKKADSAVDSSRVHFSTDEKVFENTEQTSSRLDWKPSLSSYKFQQRCLFATSYDEAYGATNQLYDFSGSVMRDSVLPKNGSLGFEWSPISYLNLRDSGGGFQTTNDFGPVMEWKTHNIPIRFNGGVSGSGWNNSLPAHLEDSRLRDFHGDAGFYGGCSAGDPTIRFLGHPLYINAEAFVRSINKVGIAVIDGSALFAHNIGNGDSLFVFYGDSLSNGKERYWGGSGGQQQYINSPWRIARSLQASGGFKLKERRGFLPAIVYSYTQNSVSYPTLAGALSDVRTSLQSLNFLVGTKEGFPVTYKGGIRVSWGTEDWLFGSDLSKAAASSQKSLLQLDSLNAKLNNHQIYRAATDHYVELTLPRGDSLEYKLSVLRDSKTYTFTYTDQGRSISKPADEDAITLNNHLGVKLKRVYGLDAELYGEYSVTTLNYLKKELSAANQTEDGYSLGLNLMYKPSERFTLNERVKADAQVFDYFYKQSHLDDPPPYKRRFSSLCTGTWKINGLWELNGRWDESYYDDGVWNGSAYFDSTRPQSLGVNYYAVKDKTTDYSVELGLAMVKKLFHADTMHIEGGCRLHDVFARFFNGRTYEADDQGIGYLVEPFFELLFKYRRFSLTGRVTRMFNTLDPDRWIFRKNWDIHIVGQAAW